MRIEEYGFLSDTETAALVGRDGSIDWLCMPRFDSAACFAKLLGDAGNGFWRVAPAGAGWKATRAYRDGTLILETRFETEEGAVRLIDCMPIRDELPDVVRVVEGIRGQVAMRMDLVVRFDYGQMVPWVQRQDSGLVALAGPNALLLRTNVETKGENLSTVAEFTLGAGDRAEFILTWFPSHKPVPQAKPAEESLRQTEHYWKEWSDAGIIESEWAADVKRSLLVLKGLTYAPTGGVIAAATTSLPEQLNGERNWDYRYCWLRDATFTLYSLLDAGYTEEAVAWHDWLLRAIAGSPWQMQILYGPAGERNLLEYELPHLSGYEGAKPVRIGNAAANQFQLDVYGEIMDAMHHAREAGIQCDKRGWQMQRHLADFVAKHWRDPDEGIWEVRGGRRNFTHSKLMAWVALDRAIKGCARHALAGDTNYWKSVRTEIHSAVCREGFNPIRNAFTQSFGCDRLDASLLMMPLVGFLPATDPRVQSTIAAIQKELTVDNLVLRYHPAQSAGVDGLPPGEGAFLPCTFWLADCLNLLGRTEEAREIFAHLLTLRNDLGLLAEEYDTVHHRQVGNFPQAFSHVALVNTANNLTRTKGPAADRSACGAES